MHEHVTELIAIKKLMSL